MILGIKDEAKNIQQSLEGLALKIVGVENIIGNLKKDITDNNLRIGGLKEEFEKIRKGFDVVQNKVLEFEGAVSENREKIQQFLSLLSNLKVETKEIEDRLIAKIDAVQNQVLEHDAAVLKNAEEIQQFLSQLSNFKGEIREIEAGLTGKINELALRFTSIENQVVENSEKDKLQDQTILGLQEKNAKERERVDNELVKLQEVDISLSSRISKNSERIFANSEKIGKTGKPSVHLRVKLITELRDWRMKYFL